MCDSLLLSLHRGVHMCMLTCMSVHMYVSVSLCVGVFVVCVCTCEPVHAEPAADFGSLPRSLSTLLIKAGSLTCPGSLPVWLV